MKKWLIPFLFILLFVVACSDKDSDTKDVDDTNGEKVDVVDGDYTPLEKKTTVIVAEDGAASGAGFYIADAMGYFDEYNIEIKFATFGNSDEMLPALAAGEVDVAGGISTASFFNSIAQGIDVKMIADKGHNNPGSSYFTFVIREDLQDDIKEYSDFKGRKIAVSTQNAVDDYIFGEMIKHAGLTRDDVEFVLMSDFPNMMAAMANKQIDAALQIEPFITQGTYEGIHVRFRDATDYAPEAQIAMVLASPEFMREKRDVAKRFMAAYLKGVRDYNDAFIKGTGDLDRVIEIMTEYTALKDPEIWKDVGVTGLDPNGKMFVENITDQYEAYKENGAISGDVDLDKAVDTSLVEEVLEVIGLYE